MAVCCPTEEFILSAAKTTSLASIEVLRLNNANIEEIDATVFSKLTSLKTLDLSGNELSRFPANLVLKNLKLLDLSDNRLTSASFVKQFPKLQDVYLHGNPMSRDMKYMAAMENKSLKFIDDTSTDTYTSLAVDFNDRLESQIEGVWEARYGDKYNEGIPRDEVDKVREKFLKDLEMAKLEGAVNNMPNFTHPVSIKLGTELFNRIVRGAYEPPCKKRRLAAANNTLVSPRKTQPRTPSRRHSMLLERTPNKLGTPSRRLSLIHEARNTSQPQQTPTKQNSAPSTTSVQQLKAKKSRKRLPSVSDYDPDHFIRCHFGGSRRHVDNDPTDHRTTVWKCLFEPDPQNAGEETGVVATCGGNIVCLIDVRTGRVVKRFKQDMDGGQNFFTLAWTTVKMESEARQWPSNILAVGGINGEVHLLHPDQLVSYAEFSINQTMTNYCTALCFHPLHPTILFCGDDTGKFISVWDVGIPKGDDYQTTCRKLCQFKMNGGCTNEIIFCKKNHLIVASHKGLFAWKLGTKVPKEDRNVEYELILPLPREKVDGLVMASEDVVACKVVKHGCIYLWRPSLVLNSKQTLKTPRKVTVELLAVLEWTTTNDYYLGLTAKNGLLTCGDNKGGIWLYNIQKLVNQKAETDELLEPSRILDWPECDTTNKRDTERKMIDLNDNEQEIGVTSAALSKDGRHIVATTMNNMVCTWKMCK